MVYRLAAPLINRALGVPAVKRAAWGLWYETIARVLGENTPHFMNGGYVDLERSDWQPTLDATEEPDRLPIQLYHSLASGVELAGRQVLEVGSGHGGGSRYLCSHHHPALMVGLDRSELAVVRSARNFILPNLYFLRGDAESLPFEDSAFDVIVNVESSHCYGSMARFLGEVRRVLRQRGQLLLTDFRAADAIADLERSLAQSGFEVLARRDISRQVFAALQQQGPRRRKLILDHAPSVLHAVIGDFASLEGSNTYLSFKTGEFRYLSYILLRR
jgi:SAM-dependent methyltransferase